ncbi:MAG: hypothetical protein JKX82_00670, partial [Oleispira sp.]|nr:hypothetical protein [Oleispira sp.]
NLIESTDDLKRYIAKNGQFHIARMASFIYRKSDNWDDVDLLKSQLSDLESDSNLIDEHAQTGFDAIMDVLNENETLKIDLNNTLKSSSFDNLLSAELHKNYGLQQKTELKLKFK